MITVTFHLSSHGIQSCSPLLIAPTLHYILVIKPKEDFRLSVSGQVVPKEADRIKFDSVDARLLAKTAASAESSD